MKIRRIIKYWWQRRTRGWDDSDLWSLDFTIIRFTLPRLKEFRKQCMGYPAELNSFEEWEDILDKMIAALEIYLKEESYIFAEDVEEFKEGINLFFKYFFHLWS